jgi:hypothetical protein
MSRRTRIFHPRLAAALAILLLATMAHGGCTSTNRLREAQTSFNEAAIAESQLRFGDALTAGSLQGQVTQNTLVQNGYASALLSLDKLEPRDVDRLKQDKLWGNVLALRALAQWKLGMLDQARDTAKEAQQVGADQIFPRDRALLLALPGLIKTDEAFAALERLPAEPTPEQRTATLRNVQLLIADAADAIDRGRGAADPPHPVHVYLIQAKLAALRNLQVAHQRLGDGDARTLPADRREEAQGLLKELHCRSERLELKNDPTGYWANKLTLTPAPGAC